MNWKSNILFVTVMLTNISYFNALPIESKALFKNEKGTVQTKNNRKLVLNENKTSGTKQRTNDDKKLKNECLNLYFISICMGKKNTGEVYSSAHHRTSRQMPVSMSTEDMNIYDGILQNGDPSLTFWTSYNTRGQKTLGIDITEYVVGFIER